MVSPIRGHPRVPKGSIEVVLVVVIVVLFDVLGNNLLYDDSKDMSLEFLRRWKMM